MPKLFHSSLIAFAVVASLGLAQAATTKGKMVSGPVPTALTEQGDTYVLNRGFADFYDTAWVLTNGSNAKPQVVEFEVVADTLAAYDVVFFGEVHRHPGVHLQQQRLLSALHTRYPRWIVSLEQFERDVQPVVDDYLAGKIGETTLVDKGRAWDNYRPSYRPLVQFAKDNKLPVVAAEAPVWAISCIGQAGPEVLDMFTPEERSWVAKDLHIAPGAYRDKYMKFQGGTATHGGGAAQTPQALLRAERSYAGQVARDDSMAESIFLAMQNDPGYKVLHLNGHFHSAGFLGTVEQLKLRNPALKIAVIQPIEVKNSKTPAFEKTALTEGTFLQLVYPNPDDFAEGEDQSEWIKKVMAKRTANPCKYTTPPAPATHASAPTSASAKP
jgi:uncharacterized iron-regulated protein